MQTPEATTETKEADQTSSKKEAATDDVGATTKRMSRCVACATRSGGAAACACAALSLSVCRQTELKFAVFFSCFDQKLIISHISSLVMHRRSLFSRMNLLCLQLSSCQGFISS